MAIKLHEIEAAALTTGAQVVAVVSAIIVRERAGSICGQYWLKSMITVELA